MTKEPIQEIIDELESELLPAGQGDYYESGFNGGIYTAINLLEELLDKDKE